MSTSTATLTSSTRDAADACLRHVIPAGEPWVGELTAGQTIRLLDLQGNQAVDTLFFARANPRERYDPQRTLRRQRNLYLSTGTVLYSNLGRVRLCLRARSPRVSTLVGALHGRLIGLLRF